jgi:hypothetical protein
MAFCHSDRDISTSMAVPVLLHFCHTGLVGAAKYRITRSSSALLAASRTCVSAALGSVGKQLVQVPHLAVPHAGVGNDEKA